MSNLKIVEIIAKDAALYQDIIQLLEGLIEKAQSGDIFSVGVVTLHQDQSVGTAWSKGAETQMHKFIGGIETLKHRAITELMEW